MTAWVQGDERREAIMQFIRDYWDEFGIAPSMQEITEGVGLNSKTATRHHLLILAEEGRVSSQQGKYRSIRVTEPVQAA